MKKQSLLESAKQWYRDYKVAESYHQFSTFVESLKRTDSEAENNLLESVQTGINSITESNGYAPNDMLDRLISICEAADDEEFRDFTEKWEDTEEVSTVEVKADSDDAEEGISLEDDTALTMEDIRDMSYEQIMKIKPSQISHFNDSEKEEFADIKKARKGGSGSHVSDKTKLRDKYSMLLNTRDTTDEGQFIKAITPGLIKIAENYGNPDVQEEVFAGLLKWSLTQRKSIKSKVDKGEMKPFESEKDLAGFVINSRSKFGRKSRLSHQKSWGLADRARGIVRKPWKSGVKPYSPYTVTHKGAFYELKPEKVDKIEAGSEVLEYEPHTPEGKDIWQEITREEYMSKMGSEPSLAQQVSVSAPIGDSGEGDMTQEEKIAGKSMTDAKSDVKKLFAQLQTELTDMNEWAKKSGKVKPFKDDILKMLKLKLTNPGITDADLLKEIPSLPKKVSSAGVSKVHPQIMKRSAEKLKEFFKEPKFEKFNELSDLISALETERDEVDAAV